ncbi:hypothetical protein SPI_06564 [Niveomyces insectorum RCEF 264]|uniref:Uncharacterized protein n=1 Tax=Niveomyces insectorum RCEF 264 TaxID=1081102 RepID=A0A167RDJ8_9HYPO|nr:hypothetical protein SPI_06564 [Niveomyces insectorum RCEF 264]
METNDANGIDGVRLRGRLAESDTSSIASSEGHRDHREHSSMDGDDEGEPEAAGPPPRPLLDPASEDEASFHPSDTDSSDNLPVGDAQDLLVGNMNFDAYEGLITAVRGWIVVFRVFSTVYAAHTDHPLLAEQLNTATHAVDALTGVEISLMANMLANEHGNLPEELRESDTRLFNLFYGRDSARYGIHLGFELLKESAGVIQESDSQDTVMSRMDQMGIWARTVCFHVDDLRKLQ